MITILDLKAELTKLTLLRGRRPETTEVERKASGGFATLAPFRDGNIYSAKFSGDGAWSAIRTAMSSCRSSTAQRRCTS